MKMLGKLVLVGILSAVSLPALAHDHHHGSGPRQHWGRAYQAPAWRGGVPVRGHCWVPGHWTRRHGGHVWIEAGWAMPPQPDWVWVGPQRSWTGGSWQWQEGRWAPRP